jgi:hypothetical protein
MRIKDKILIRQLLCRLGERIQSDVLKQRNGIQLDILASVSEITKSDTIYAIDKFSETSLLEWFAINWPKEFPVEVVAEGLEAISPIVFPDGIQHRDTKFKVIIDPIDGTRELMYDKRPAWVLAGVAHQKFGENRINDIEVAMMTELPVTKQRLADQISGYKGCGRGGLVAERLNLDSNLRSNFLLNPSRMKNLDHSVAGVVKIFPEGKELMARFETDLWKRLGLFGKHRSPVIFDDQYMSTGGQMYELLMGHYRFYGDIRPQALNSLGLGQSLTCHPYDVAAGLLLQEAGCVFEAPNGGEVDQAMDTVSPVAWVAYANRDLAEMICPAFRELMVEYFG